MTVPGASVALKNLSFAYPGQPPVLEGITAEWPAGGRIAIVGPSGAGKSTLLLHLNGLLPARLPTQSAQATVWIDGTPLMAGGERTVRQQVGFVFQDPDDQLFGATVAEDLAFGPRQLGLKLDEQTRRVTAALTAVGLSGVEQRNPAQLSFGERKRVCLAGVLACEPRVLVLDEPSSNLDPRARRQLMTVLRGLSQTVIAATHDLDLVLDEFDRLVLLDGGRIQAEGPPDRLLSDARLMERHGLEVPWRLR